jgi:3-deoxy-manno-octulosonate cytidylyltransferase (CMP-KDO synthetase)
MRTIAIIPARYASTRLPGKPLLARTGKPLIQHVVERVSLCRLDDIVVATDDARIAEAVQRFGGRALMTSADHRCGTDRLAEAAALLGLADDDIVLNVQGDEPDIPPECIERLLALVRANSAPMATLATPLAPDEVANPNRVKVVLRSDGTAMYFSRAPIPLDRNGEGRASYLLHLGVYAYRAGFLRKFSAMAPTPAEQAEKLEQLRALENGYAISVAVVDYDGAGIDTPEDYDRFVQRYSRGGAER